jgi:glycosyltransferase involved in cell wall biosynthesis
MATGTAAVASPVGVNKEILRHGENGFLVDGVDGWIDALSRLIEDVDLRRRIGHAGRESLKGRYTVRDWAEPYADLIEEVAGFDPRESAP